MRTFVPSKKKYHNPETLSSREIEVVTQWQHNYRIPKPLMEKAADKLSQGERDALEQVREALSWPTVMSLAYKYFPLYPHRKLWAEALKRTQRLARFVNIRYLLLTIKTILAEKAAERKRTTEGLSIDKTPIIKREYQLITANEQRLEARRLAKLALAAEGGAIG